MRRLIELAIRRPAVADEDAVELGAEHGRRFVKPASVLNGVDDRARGRKDPQHQSRPLTFQLVSSGLTTGLPRIVGSQT